MKNYKIFTPGFVIKWRNGKIIKQWNKATHTSYLNSRLKDAFTLLFHDF